MNRDAFQQVELPSFIDGVEVDQRLQGVPLTKKTDPVKPLMQATAHTRIFDLSKEEDVKEYSDVKTLCKNMTAEMQNIQIEWVETTQNFKVLCEWCTYMITPKIEGLLK